MAQNSLVVNITDENFEEEAGKGLCLVDFWAPWCRPCVMQGPILEKVAQNVGDKARIFKINVDENNEVAGKFGISSIPSLIIFKDGEKVQQFVGLQQAEALYKALESFM